MGPGKNFSKGPANSRPGYHFREGPDPGRSVLLCTHDSNFWKGFVYRRLNTAPGERGCLDLFGRQPEIHELFSNQVTAERRIDVEDEKGHKELWKLIQGRENHFLDVLVGCCVMAPVTVVDDKPEGKVEPTRVDGILLSFKLEKEKQGEESQ